MPAGVLKQRLPENIGPIRAKPKPCQEPCLVPAHWVGVIQQITSDLAIADAGAAGIWELHWLRPTWVLPRLRVPQDVLDSKKSAKREHSVFLDPAAVAPVAKPAAQPRIDLRAAEQVEVADAMHGQ